MDGKGCVEIGAMDDEGLCICDEGGRGGGVRSRRLAGSLEDVYCIC